MSQVPSMAQHNSPLLKVIHFFFCDIIYFDDTMHQDTHYWYPPETIVLSVVPFIIVKEKQCAAFNSW